MSEQSSEARSPKGQQAETPQEAEKGHEAPAEEQGEASDNEQIEQLQAELEQAKAEQLRALAELENVRKRARRDVETARKFAVEKLAEELLTVMDSLEMGLKAAEGEEPNVEQLKEGKAMTLRQLKGVMERAGIAELDPQGEPFNPEFHEAMTMQESQEQDPDTVLTVVQKGYLLKGRLLRPARVVVAKAPESEG